MFTGKGVNAMWASSHSHRIAAFRATVEYVLGQSLEPIDIARLTAVPDGSDVLIYSDGPHEFKVESFSQEYGVQMHRRFTRGSNGEIVVYHAKMRANPPGRGHGLRIFSTAVDRYAHLGVARIDVAASRVDHEDETKRENGYYVWARFGFRLEFDKEMQSKIDATEWQGTRNTHELFQLGGDAARQWWKKFGDSSLGEFEVRPNSPHNEMLSEYIRERGEN